jgi:lactoylglutathione lyase
MSIPSLQLLVIKTLDPEKLSKEYELLGITFLRHKHGNGATHYAADLNGLIFEIYPLSKGTTVVDISTRLGFTVQSLDILLNKLISSNWTIVSAAQYTEFGYSAVIQDNDGRKVELTERQ